MAHARLALCLVALASFAGCTVGPDLPPPSAPSSGPAPALVDLSTLPAQGTAENPGPDLLRRADGLRGG